MEKNLNQLELIPPYCPNSHCLFHMGTDFRFYVKNGWTKTDKPPFQNQRYKCKNCGEQFSANTFKLDFRKRKINLSETVLHNFLHGMSNNSIARRMEIAEGTVRNRIRDMARQSLYFEKRHFPDKLNEDVAYDGFETFTHSQFSPCYVNTAVGRKSLFIYHNTFSPLNRKGRMTEEQRIKNIELIQKHGLYPQNSVFEETRYIFKSLSQIGAGRTIYSDEHKSYSRAARADSYNLDFKTISSRKRRDAANPLFPINHLHLLYRHFFSSQKRETIAFQKNEAGLMEKIQLMKIYRNFMNPKFVRKNKYDPHAHEWSPAMYVGVADKILSFEEIFGVRRLKTQIKLDQKEKDFIERKYPFSRQKIAG